MDITDFIATPTITALTVDDEAIVAAFKEPLTFHIVLPIPLEDYTGLAKLTAAELVKKLLVNKDGEKLLTENKSLSPLLISAVNNRIWAELGKLPEVCLTQNQNQSI